ncbi:MAG: quinoprotein relay system zinc metallohydrolase 2 [Gammaproteobacteria bacterium]|nr:quinoprotein relay system zinc metallohydrolase 2 [Gammaproteobacteria bacterium]MCI0590350.1 quinoprotein relay system zinc metallohydrolase 2 [Gammaproteobacteria bacterium]
MDEPVETYSGWGARKGEQRLKFVLLFFLVGTPGHPAAQAGSSPLAVTEVAPGVYVHQGLHEDATPTNQYGIANIGFIVGENCVAVIDTGGSIEVGQALKETIRNTTNHPVCYVINTHVHPDHIFGNLAFKEDNPVYIAHVKFPDALAERAPYYLRNLSRLTGKSYTETLLVIPDRTVTDAMDLDLGGRGLRIVAHPTAHTNNDLTVYDVKTKTLWLSDLLFMERIPALDGSIKGWLAVTEQLKSVDAERVIPGHGPVSAKWPEALADQERYLRTLLTEIRQFINQGGLLEEALDRVGYSEMNSWRLFDDYHRRNVTSAFAELEWE